jgi:hypothetical protein
MTAMTDIPMYHPLRDPVPPPGTDFTIASAERRGYKLVTDSEGLPVWVPSYLIYRIEANGRVIAKPPRPTDLVREYESIGELIELWMTVNRQHINA